MIAMRVLVLILIVSSIATVTYAQSDKLVYKNECTVELERVKVSGTNSKEFGGTLKKPRELDKIDISGATEGSTISRRYKIDKKSIYAHVNLFFEDDLRYERTLTDAVTVWILITQGPRRSGASAFALTRVQSSYDEGFKRLIASAIGKKNGVMYGINVDCQAH